MSLEETLRDDPETVASIIDHTNVDPTATEAEIRKLCTEVREYGFCSAVVVPYHAQLADELVGDGANVVAVVGFPYGIQNSAAKRAEIESLTGSVDEFDMVMNRTAFANDDEETVIEDVKAATEAAGDRTLKCIIESPTLSESEIQRAAALVEAGGADFVKTAVGYDGPTDPAEIGAIRNGIEGDTGIKASGGIGSFEEALEMVSAGASRIGASSGVEIYESTQ
ncbi:deoxyribose-phosphate aldolase [Natronomonas sp. F2-12]|jgi:deoxyribose-phosphate aldolase|uniref:Deoxyribose-phosphate aldolase n=1 Tax=Natronomonas aquatica TaxID=2841590 RepID=A0A9R1CVL1_9EURY|nr:deoxyribose-phosphate aldolase [Natronomonas aquatica]MCQ4334980.1 deoxyribose-phosphate aldolase [Natronomonas aquatica]